MNRSQIGQATTAKCRRCEVTFAYVYKGHVRWVCPECIELSQKASSKRFGESLHYNEGEIAGLSSDGIGALAKCNYIEAAKRLALWEAFERLLAGEDDVVADPMSDERIRQIERSALNKIRRAMSGDFEDWLEHRAQSSGEYATATTRTKELIH